MNKKTFIYTILLAVFSCYFGYLAYRAYAIPVTHDEGATAILCWKNRTAQIIRYDYGYISGNNHILNSLSIRFFIRRFHGFSPLSIRAGNLIAGALFLWVGLVFAFRYFNNNWARSLAGTIWVSNPYAMEFFGLSRGYGMSMALEAAAILCTASYFETPPEDKRRVWKWLILSNLSAILAVWANFATLNFYLYFVPAQLALIWYKQRKITTTMSAPLIGAAVLYAMCAVPIAKIKKAGDFGFFGSESFWHDTVQTFMSCALMDHPYAGPQTALIASWIISIMAFSAVIAAIWRWYKQPGTPTNALWAWMTLLLPGTILVNILIAKINHTSWLNTRTTLLYYPLLVVCLLGLVRAAFDNPGLWQKVLISLLIALPVGHFANVANLVQSHEWKYDRDTYKVLDYMEQCYQTEQPAEPYQLHVYCLQHPSFQFHTWLSKSHYNRCVKEVQEVPFRMPEQISTDVDFYYIPEDRYPAFAQQYAIVLKLLDDQMLLLRKKNKL